MKPSAVQQIGTGLRSAGSWQRTAGSRSLGTRSALLVIRYLLFGKPYLMTLNVDSDKEFSEDI